MNENIGAKGGTNDRKRTFKILKRNQEKLTEEELELLEKRVRKKQIISLITVLPIAIVGVVAATLTGKSLKEERKTNSVGPKKQSVKPPVEKDEVEKQEKEQDKKVIIPPKVVEEIIPTKEEEEKLDKELSKIRSKKILEEYEDRLKDLRYKLRNSYYEKDILDEARKLEDNPSIDNLDRINALINKLDEYKESIEINSKFLSEENYIKELVKEDLDKIKNETVIVDTTKADLFKSIDIKVDEIKSIEDNIKISLEQDKIIKNIDDDKLENLKEEKQNTKKYSEELTKFQDEQIKINLDVEEKLKKEVNNFEKNRIQLSGMTIGSNLLVRNVRRSMTSPGVRSGRRIFNFITTYLYYFSMMSTLKPIKKRYKKINLEKYRKEVETSIGEIDEVLRDITKTSNKLETIINKFIKKYESFSNTSEYKKILDNLEKMQEALKEKEYELLRIKKEQEKKYQENLEDNKVYKL